MRYTRSRVAVDGSRGLEDSADGGTGGGLPPHARDFRSALPRTLQGDEEGGNPEPYVRHELYPSSPDRDDSEAEARAEEEDMNGEESPSTPLRCRLREKSSTASPPSRSKKSTPKNSTPKNKKGKDGTPSKSGEGTPTSGGKCKLDARGVTGPSPSSAGKRDGKLQLPYTVHRCYDMHGCHHMHRYHRIHRCLLICTPHSVR